MSRSESARRPKRSAPGGIDAGPRSYHHGNLRAALLEAAERMLAEQGERALTLRDVARAAGVSHAAPYHHFGSREAMLAAVAERGFEALGGAIREAVAVPDPTAGLLRTARAYVAFARSDPERFRLMFGPLLARQHVHPSLAAAARDAFGHVRRVAIERDGRDGPDLAAAAWSLAHGFSQLAIDGAFDGTPASTRRLEATVTRLMRRLVGPG